MRQTAQVLPQRLITSSSNYCNSFQLALIKLQLHSCVKAAAHRLAPIATQHGGAAGEGTVPIFPLPTSWELSGERGKPKWGEAEA